MQQTDKSKKQQKRIPQITTRLEQIDKVLNKLYEDNALVLSHKTDTSKCHRNIRRNTIR